MHRSIDRRSNVECSRFSDTRRRPVHAYPGLPRRITSTRTEFTVQRVDTRYPLDDGRGRPEDVILESKRQSGGVGSEFGSGPFESAASVACWMGSIHEAGRANRA